MRTHLRTIVKYTAATLIAYTTLTAFADSTDVRPVWLILGDSLSAEYGLKQGEGWVEIIQTRSPGVKIVNASISGKTSAAGRSRLPRLLKEHKPALVFIELGANDGLRGLPPNQLKENLSVMCRTAKAQGSEVIIAGMQIPTNYGNTYTKAFEKAFVEAAQECGAQRIPFFLEGVANAPNARDLFQDDGLHPTAAAQRIIANHVWPSLRAYVVPRRTNTRINASNVGLNQ